VTDELLKLRGALEHLKDVKVDLLGEGAPAFLYVLSPERAVEVSIDSPGGFFVEYWDHADLESYEPSVKTENVPTSSEVILKLTEWFGKPGF
jgi:hypothetical protein